MGAGFVPGFAPGFVPGTGLLLCKITIFTFNNVDRSAKS